MDGMSIPLIEKDFHKDSSSKNNLDVNKFAINPHKSQHCYRKKKKYREAKIISKTGTAKTGLVSESDSSDNDSNSSTPNSESKDKHAEQKVENELEYLRDSITTLKREMERLRSNVHCVNAKGKCDKYNSVTSYVAKHQSFASSETDTSDDGEILTCTSKTIPVKKIHESKDLDPVYSKSKKK
ncbi:hypothetical protein Glove_566g35 [Diversispora epigaea]|uniref:Uncharacterized protein n=1 Tax=Diversispora epigaea TaxID=1348612 RepID=A0A397GA61_9GLOM|nr:hypothetical protein Glove_566g35 [Diversispora epigaea]